MNKEFIDHYRFSDVQAENILQAQQIARDCLEYMKDFIKPGMQRETIWQECADFMTGKGSQGWWIHNDPALILYGDLTTYSAHEEPAELFVGIPVKENDLITIDVAPMIGTGWGDMARTFLMQDGKITDISQARDHEVLQGMTLEYRLHTLFVDSVNEKTTFADVYRFTHDFLKAHGYVNCDYHDNYGHTIENGEFDRIPIAKDNHTVIAAYDKPITYEPFIKAEEGRLGIKFENMYFFHEGKMRLVL